jgi:hypothetical protein
MDFLLADILHDQDATEHISKWQWNWGFVNQLQATHCNQVSNSSRFYG